MKVTFEWDEKCQYGGPIWVIVKVDGVKVAMVEWINGPPFLEVSKLTSNSKVKKS